MTDADPDLDSFPFDKVIQRSTCNHEILFKSIVEELKDFYNIKEKIDSILKIYNKLGYDIQYTVENFGNDIIFRDDDYEHQVEYRFSSDGTYKIIKTYRYTF
jgi:hypothetical protein